MARQLGRIFKFSRNRRWIQYGRLTSPDETEGALEARVEGRRLGDKLGREMALPRLGRGGQRVAGRRRSFKRHHQGAEGAVEAQLPLPAGDGAHLAPNQLELTRINLNSSSQRLTFVLNGVLSLISLRCR